MNKFKLNDKGFSLLELIIGLAISAFVIVAALSFVLTGTKSYQNNSKMTKLQNEVSYTNNLIGQAIREGKTNSTYIVYTNSGKNIELHTGKKVFYYNDSQKKLFVYKEVTGSNYAANDPDNLVTEHLTDFKVNFVNANGTTQEEDLKNDAMSYLDPNGDGTLVAYSSVVRVEATYKYKDKTQASAVSYQIRN